MHELSIAHSLVEVASEAAQKAGAERVFAVHIRLGVLVGVVRSSLEFCYDLTTEGTILEGSQLAVRELPVIIYCAECEREMELSKVHNFCCPHCHTPSGEVRQGRELEIDFLEVEDQEGQEDEAPNS